MLTIETKELEISIELKRKVKHYKEMEQDKRHLQVEIRKLENKNEELQKENR